VNNNLLKNFIEVQNSQCNEQTFKSLFRSVLEPFIESKEEGVIFHRLIKGDGLIGLIKRVEFSAERVKSFNFVDDSELIKNKIWGDTEFLLILTNRYGVGLIWENNAKLVDYYLVFNSNKLLEILDVINANSKKELKRYVEKYNSDRRANKLLNECINNMVGEISSKSDLEKPEKTEDEEYINKRTSIVSHEIRNQLSICDLYLSIIKKYCSKNKINHETIDNAIECMTRSIKVASNCLLELKSINTNNINPYNLKDIVDQVTSMGKAYTETKDIKLVIDNEIRENVLVDENKFSAVLINLIKNASEAFKQEEERKDKYIKIKTTKKEGFAKVSIENNGAKIAETDRLFEWGYTTKREGTGLGLMISKRSMEEQFGKLELVKSDENSTEFEVTVSIV